MDDKIPTADVSDEAITSTLANRLMSEDKSLSYLSGFYASRGPYPIPDSIQVAKSLLPTVKSLLDAQAAAHAADLAKHEHKLRSLAEDMGLGPMDDRPLQPLFNEMRMWVGNVLDHAAEVSILKAQNDNLAVGVNALDAEVEALRAEVKRLKYDTLLGPSEVERDALLADRDAYRALLDAQAAEVERLNDSLDYANKGKAELEAEVEALRAEVERLGQVPADAMSVLHAVAERMDDFAYDELRSVIEDGIPLSDDGEPIVKGATLAEVRADRDA